MANRAIILAAGRGSRMGSETELKPKCLTEFEGNTLLSWQLKSITEAGLLNKNVVTGYKKELLKGDFQTYHNDRWNKTNMVSSLFCAPDFDGDTIISYSDIVYHSDHIKSLEESSYDITITADLLWESLWSVRFEDPLDDAETFIYEQETLIEIGNKTTKIEDIQAQYMGLLKLSKQGWNIMKSEFDSLSDHEQDKMDMTSMLNLLLSKGIEINIVFIKGKWCEIDSMSDKLAYENALKTNKEWSHDWR